MSRVKYFCVLACLPALMTMAPDEVQARRRIIICYPVVDQIEPAAELGPNGRTVEVTLGGPIVQVFGGTHIDADVLVYQETSGAVGIGHWVAKRADEDAPETVTFPVLVQAIGETPFVTGPATTCYFAEERVGGKLVREWTRCVDVLLSDER